MTMQKHVLAALTLLLASTTNAGRAEGKARRGLEDAPVEQDLGNGEWKDGVRCNGGVLSELKGWLVGQKEPMETVEVAKKECAAACDANDLCANANLFYNENQGSSACYLRTDECVGESEHPRYYTYSKGATTSPTCKWQTGVRCAYGFLALGYDGPFDWTEERAQAECAALCIQNDECAYADLYYTSSTKSCSLMTDECGDHGLKQNSDWRMYSKYGTCHPDIEVAPVSEPTPAPTPLSESAGVCECKNLINENGLGNCQKEYEFLGNRLICYVELPSTCTDLQQSATNAGEFFSAEACYSGDWIADTKCSSAPEHRTLVFNKWSDEQTEQQYKNECQSACDEEDSCVAAEFYYTTAPTVARCWQLDECEIAGKGDYQLYIKGGVNEATDAPTDMPTPSPTDVPTSAPTDADSEEGCENLTVRKNMLVSIKKGKKQKKTMKLKDDSKEDVCECAELCKNAGYDLFQYYSLVKRGKVKTSCQCMNLTNKVKAKTKKGYTAGALSPAAEEAFSKFKVKTSKKDQKAGQ